MDENHLSDILSICMWLIHSLNIPLTHSCIWYATANHYVFTIYIYMVIWKISNAAVLQGGGGAKSNITLILFDP